MPKNKKYISLINLGSKHSLLMKCGQYMSYYERKSFIKKFHKNCNLLKTSFKQVLLCLQRIKHNFYWKMKFLKQATYIRYVITNLSKFVQISKVTSTESFFTEDSLKIRKGLELVSRPHFS